MDNLYCSCKLTRVRSELQQALMRLSESNTGGSATRISAREALELARNPEIADQSGHGAGPHSMGL